MWKVEVFVPIGIGLRNTPAGLEESYGSGGDLTLKNEERCEVLKRRYFSGAAISGESGVVGGRSEVKRAHSIDGKAQQAMDSYLRMAREEESKLVWCVSLQGKPWFMT